MESKVAPKGKRKYKTRGLMLSQSSEQNARASIRIEELLAKDLKDTIDFHINKFGSTFERKLGLTKDDLLNDMREQIWKGLLTHSPQGKANLKTYLNTLVKNRFRVLFRRSTINKYSCVDFYADVYTTSGIDEEHLLTEETGETVFERREIIMNDKAMLGPMDAIIYGDLLLGRTIDEMIEHNKMSRVKVTAAILRIDDMAKRRARG